MASIKNYRQLNDTNITDGSPEANPYFNGIVKIGRKVDVRANSLVELERQLPPSAAQLGKRGLVEDEEAVYICTFVDGEYKWIISKESSNDTFAIVEDGDSNIYADIKEYYRVNFALRNRENYLYKFETILKPWIANPQFKDISVLSERPYPKLFLKGDTADLILFQLSTEHNMLNHQEDQYSDKNQEIIEETFSVKIREMFVPVLDCFGKQSPFYIDIIVSEEVY